MTIHEYTVHFQRGRTVGARSLRMVTVEAGTAGQALELAYAEFPADARRGYRVTRIDHFDNAGHIVIDR